MKYIFYSLLFFFFISCEIKKDQEVQGPMVVNKDGNVESLDTPYECFIYAANKDTIKLQLKQKEDELEGWLNYQFYEKDGSIGKVEGKLVGDTLKLEYEFLAEGKISETEIYFLRNTTELRRGSGEMRMDEDSVMVYVNAKQLKFTDPTPLILMKSCPADFISSKDKKIYQKINNLD
jgi:hypothetical protein